jgi:hypothetical protein
MSTPCCSSTSSARGVDRQEASLFFRLVSYRYGRGAMLITTNKSIRDWTELLAGDEVLGHGHPRRHGHPRPPAAPLPCPQHQGPQLPPPRPLRTRSSTPKPGIPRIPDRLARHRTGCGRARPSFFPGPIAGRCGPSAQGCERSRRPAKAEGEVLEWRGGQGPVLVRGERWKAVSSDALRKHQRIQVTAVEGLTVSVRPDAADTKPGR